MKDQTKKWLAVYTKPRTEKKVFERLTLKDVDAWCPLQKVQKQWSDRKKIVEEPVFKSYVFVHIADDDRKRVLQTEGVINFVMHMNRPAVIREQEVATIKSFLLEKDAEISVQSLQLFNAEDKVIIRHGVFMDNTGTVVRAATRKIYVRLESLEQVMIVEFPASFVEHFMQRTQE